MNPPRPIEHGNEPAEVTLCRIDRPDHRGASCQRMPDQRRPRHLVGQRALSAGRGRPLKARPSLTPATREPHPLQPDHHSRRATFKHNHSCG